MPIPRRIALFVTCLVDQAMPEIGVATVRLLRAAGFEVDFPEAQTCCGQPFFNSGYQDQARALARRTVELLDPYDAVVLPGGSCTSMIRLEYPHLLEGQPAAYYAAKRVAAKTYELSDFLTRFAPHFPQLSDIRHPTSDLTYHDSCHMNRLLGIREAPRALLRAAGYDIREMAESERCCGFGGLFSVKMPEVSNAMTAEKLRQAADSGAQVVVTADPGCLQQMRGLLGADAPVQVRHLAEVLAEALEPNGKTPHDRMP